MKRLIVAIAFSMMLAGLSGSVVALAQPVDVDIARGEDGNCTVSGPPGDRVVFCKDLSPGSGSAVSAPGVDAREVTPAPEPAPDASSAPDTSSAPETTGGTAVATAADQDADNLADELEPGLGLDPTNPDTDGDGVADGDEINIYGTDPLNPDTDGDGLSDGHELFWTNTDPLVPDAPSEQGG